MPALSISLERTLEVALALADNHEHEYATLEHLLLALLDDDDASEVLSECLVDEHVLREQLKRFIDEELSSLIVENHSGNIQPTAGLRRVVQRAVLHMESAGRDVVNGANILVSIFSETDSTAVGFLKAAGITRYDAVNYVNHGVSKRQRVVRSTKEKSPKIDETYIAQLEEKYQESERQLSKALKVIGEHEKTIEVLAKKLSTSSIEHPDVFVSYKQSERHHVSALVENLRKHKFSVWWDVDIEAGAPWEATIEKYVENCKVMIVCWSFGSTKSENVKGEARYARDRGKLIQIYLDDCPPPLFFGERQGLMFNSWDRSPGANCYQQLVENLRRKLLDTNSFSSDR